MRNCLVVIWVCIGAVLAQAAPLMWHNVALGDEKATVNCFLIDSEGVALLGANSGLWAYNGYGNAQQLLSGYQIYSLVEHADSLLAATNHGLLTCRRTAPHTFRIQNLRKPAEIRALALHGNTLWLGSLYGLDRLDLATGRMQKVSRGLPAGAVYSLLITPGGTLWVGTYNGLGYIDLATGNAGKVTLDGATPANTFVNALAYSPDTQRLWIGTEEGLWWRDADGRTSRLEQMGQISVKALALCPVEKSLAIGTHNGLYILEDKNGVIATYRHNSRMPFSLGNNVIWGLLDGPDGTLWAGTEAGFSVASHSTPFSIVELLDPTGIGEGNRIHALLRDCRNTLWAGGTNGLLALEPDGTRRHYAPGNSDTPLSHNRIRHLYESPQGQLWVATDGGLNRYVPATRSFNNYRLRHSPDTVANWVYGMVESADGTLWVGSYLGGIMQTPLSALPASGGIVDATRHYGTATGLSNNFVNRLCADHNGNLWVLLFTDSLVTRLSTPTLQLHPLRDGGDYPTGLFIDSRNRVWVTYAGGVLCYDATSGRLISRHTLPGTDARNGEILATCEVGSRLWLSTPEGVWAIDRDNRRPPALLTLPARGFTALYLDPLTGHVIAGDEDRLFDIDAEKLLQTHSVNRPVLWSAEADDKPLDVADADLRIPANTATLTLRFTTLNYSTQARLAYSLDGAAPIRLGEGVNTIVIKEPGAGQHSLSVYPVDRPDMALSLPMHVAQAWYLRWWAVTIYTIIVLAITMLAIHRHRRRRQRERETDAAIERHQAEADELQRLRLSLLTAGAAGVESQSPDEQRFARINSLIEEMLDDPELSVATLAERVDLHPKQMYRLVKKVSGVTPVDYIRRMRLRRAAALLEQGNLTVQEVMYKAGFNSPGYFSRCFQAEFGCRPSQYPRAATEAPTE